jgi:hypothetical protein
MNRLSLIKETLRKTNLKSVKSIAMKFGIGAFLFFFIKGMVWLAVFWFGWEFFANFFTDSQLP